MSERVSRRHGVGWIILALAMLAAVASVPAAFAGAGTPRTGASPEAAAPVVYRGEGGSWSPLGETRVSPRPWGLATRVREPMVVAHPFDPSRLAVTYPQGPGEESHVVIRVSHDGGRTWRAVAGRPRGGGSHPMLAWGPGPRPGSARLYYTAMSGSYPDYHFTVSWSDNEGFSWHQGFTANHTRGWFGGYEDLVVDTNPTSPNYGVLYLAYNWPKDPSRGTGLHVVASGDYGRSFAEVEVPKLPSPPGYGDAWRISYRLATGPDGSAYVASYQLDLKTWRIATPFVKGSRANIGRVAYGVARLRFDRAERRLRAGPNVLVTTLRESDWNLGWALRGVNVSLVEPCWATGLAVDEGGRVYFATGADGRIRVLTSDDAGSTWRTALLPQAPAVAGHDQRSTRPDVVAGHGFVAILLHTVDAAGSDRRYGTAMAVSFDRGTTWVGPRPVTTARWRINPVLRLYNGPGLRDRAAILADGGTLYVAYGDGRDGMTSAFGSRVAIDVVPVPEPSPTPPPATPDPSPSASQDGSAAPSDPSASPTAPNDPTPSAGDPSATAPSPSADVAPSAGVSPSAGASPSEAAGATPASGSPAAPSSGPSAGPSPSAGPTPSPGPGG